MVPGKYESKSIEFRKHLLNLIDYAKHDRTNFPLNKSIAFLEGYMAGLVQHEIEDYDAWLKDQQENADLNPHHEIRSINPHHTTLDNFLKNEPKIGN